MKNYIYITTVIVFFISCKKTEEIKPPNIIFIIADDQGYNDLGCYGSKLIKTPNIDKLASEGLMLTDYYSGASLSSPSRASLLTGCYPQRLAEYNKDKRFHTVIAESEHLLSEKLKEVGYTTGAIGKWHIGGGSKDMIKIDSTKTGLDSYKICCPEILPMQKGFDSYFGIPSSNDNNPCYLMRNNKIIEDMNRGSGAQQGISTRYTNEALSFIDKNKNNPFFLYLAHNMPHTPLWPSKQFEGTSKYGLYGDCVEEIDWNIGRILVLPIPATSKSAS